MNNVPSPNNSDSGIEQAIQAAGKTAPRVTPADLKANIVSERYFTAAEGMLGAWQYEHDTGATNDRMAAAPAGAGLLTFCVLTLRNGYTVHGHSACASPENYDADIGRRIARENAVQAIWPLMGYALKERLHHGPLSIEAIARTCHEVNKAYCEGIGDTSQPAWENAPDWQKSSAMAGVTLHLNNPGAGPQASHESWMAQKVAEGWTYGPTKDPEKKQHHCMVPFDQLPVAQQAKDYIFRGVVHALKELS